MKNITTVYTYKYKYNVKNWLDKQKASYSSTSFCEKSIFYGFYRRLERTIDRETTKDAYYGLRIAEVHFRNKPNLICVDSEVITLAIIRLLIKYVKNYLIFEYAKFTISYKIIKSNDLFSFTIGESISLLNSDYYIYTKISKLVRKKGEEYKNSELNSISIRVYYGGYKSQVIENKDVFSSDELAQKILDFISSDIEGDDPVEVVNMDRGMKPRYPNYIPVFKQKKKNINSFIVADLETVTIDDVHVPYAAGFLVVNQDINLTMVANHLIERYFSEDHWFIPDFKNRSNRMMFDFLDRISKVVDKKIRTVYFHNFSRFDGIILMEYYATKMDMYTIKPLMRNNILLELKVYRKGKNRLLFRIRDSLLLLPNKLAILGNTLCPQLGCKGEINHDKVNVSNLNSLKPELLEYLKQDIILLGGVMQKAQEIYWTQYNIDIEESLTLTSLSLKIFRMCYYDYNHSPIYMPNRNEDTFIRRGYYGGHADSYIPYGENLYYYDVNSLYPYVMKTFPMPGGKAVWKRNLEGEELNNIFGFIEAYVETPPTINRPFLPYRNEVDGTLLFPRGQFVGVYYSEELKYAQNLGYKVIPICGFLFEKYSSPFKNFISSLFTSRQEAKKSGDETMSFIYKTLMNSLYGRLGINPESTITEVCNRDRYDYLVKKKDLIDCNILGDHYYIISYKVNTSKVEDIEWNPPRISAVQMAAAITACARIHMYKYISRPDCYYTDTDSAVLGSPLPEEEVSSIELGKLKMEYYVKKGIFLAPKSYTLVTEDAGNIIKHKGPAKDLVSREWYELQYTDPSRTEEIIHKRNFFIDRRRLKILKKNVNITLGIKVDNKRDPVYDDNNLWVDTKPKEIIDFRDKESLIYKMKYLEFKEELDKKEKEKESIIKTLESKIAKLQLEKNKSPEEITIKESQTVVEDNKTTKESQTVVEDNKTNQYMYSPKKNKKKRKKRYKRKKRKKPKGNDTS